LSHVRVAGVACCLNRCPCRLKSQHLVEKIPAGIFHGLLYALAELAEFKGPASTYALVHAVCSHAGGTLSER